MLDEKDIIPAMKAGNVQINNDKYALVPLDDMSVSTLAIILGITADQSAYDDLCARFPGIERHFVKIEHH